MNVSAKLMKKDEMPMHGPSKKCGHIWRVTRLIKNKKKRLNCFSLFELSGGGRTRTCDLWVMSPTSYHCSTPRYATAKVLLFRDLSKVWCRKL